METGAESLKTSDKYRFSLQWGAETTEKIQTGELLESLGNRKSEFIVMAVSEYVKAHPEALSPGQKLKIVVKPNFTREQMETMVRAIIEERFSGKPDNDRANLVLEKDIKKEIEVDEVDLSEIELSAIDISAIDAMIRNLDIFNT